MILITRPKDKASKLEDKLLKYGYECHTEPLSVIKFKSQNFVFKKNQAYLISSPRTVNYVIKHGSNNLSIKLLVIGLSSFIKLKQAGFKNLIYGARDSDDMIKFLKKSNIKNIDYLTGTVRNKYLSLKINKMGISLKERIIYATTFKKSLSKKCITLIKSKRIRQVVIFSMANAQHIINVINEAKVAKDCKSLTFFCISKKIALFLQNKGFFAEYSSLPTEASLINKLKNN